MNKGHGGGGGGMGLWVLVAAAALAVLGYFAFVTVRLARDVDEPEGDGAYAGGSSGGGPIVPLPLLFAIVAGALVIAGLLIRFGQGFENPFGPILNRPAQATPSPRLGPPHNVVGG